jgi:hypothetical protein
MKVVYFSFGEGSGHVVLAASIYNSFRRKNIDVDYVALTNSRFGHLVSNDFLHIPVRAQPELLFKYDRETELYILLKDLQPDILIVDSVWLAVFPILKDFRCSKIALFFWKPDSWFNLERPGYETVRFNIEDYDYSVSCEPGFNRKGFVNIEPVVVKNRDEIISRDDALNGLGFDGERKTCVIAHNGYRGEIDSIAGEAVIFEDDHQIKVLTNEDGAGLFPLAMYANGIDYLIGGAGYNLFYEARYLGMKAKFIPKERRADDQFWRVKTNRDYSFAENGADVLVDMMMNLKH